MARSQNPSSKRSPLPSGWVGTVADDGWWPRKNSFHHPSSSYRAPFPWGEGFPCNQQEVDSATPGKPCVQNDMRVRWEIGRWNPSIKVYSYKLHDKNRSCSVLNIWINQKPSEKMPGNENTKSGILQGLFICRTSELNPRTKNIAQTKPVLNASIKQSSSTRHPLVWFL